MEKTSFTISGSRSERRNRIWVDGKEIFPEASQKIRNHSPDGFNWGYGGSGPAQAALAICIDIFNNNYIARALYQNFKFQFVAAWSTDSFSEEIDIADFLIDNREKFTRALEYQALADDEQLL
jgi:hypothetical protein